MFYVYMALMQTPILVLKQEKFFVIKLGWPPFPADLAKKFSFVQLKFFCLGFFKMHKSFTNLMQLFQSFFL